MSKNYLINCCGGHAPSLSFSSASQFCVPRNCGQQLCESDTEGGGGPYTSCEQGIIFNICAPSLSEESCENRRRRYQKVEIENRAGDLWHGFKETIQYSVDANGKCVSTITCGGVGSIVTKTEAESSEDLGIENGKADYSTTEEYKVTYNSSCMDEDVKETSSGTSSLIGGYTNKESAGGKTCNYSYKCSSTLKDGVWTGTENSKGSCTPDPEGNSSFDETEDIDRPCWSPSPLEADVTVTYTPSLECAIINTFSEPDEEKICNPQSFPLYPAFENWDLYLNNGKCGDVGGSDLQPGQGFSNEAFNHVHIHDPLETQEQKFRYRIEHPPIFPACYLKVWIQKTTQEWRYESCATDNDPCCVKYVKGDRYKTNIGSYVWEPETCDYDIEDNLLECQYRIYSEPYEVMAAINTSVSVNILKYSYVEGYEPEDPDENGNQPCRPNGWPIIQC